MIGGAALITQSAFSIPSSIQPMCGTGARRCGGSLGERPLENWLPARSSWFVPVRHGCIRRAVRRENKMPSAWKYNTRREETVISLAPLSSPFNKYVDLFSKAISDQRYAVREFRWRPAILRKTDVVILHWPNEFFTTDRDSVTLKSILKLAAIRLSKYLWRTRFIWVAHNAAPHEAKKSVPRLTRWFLRSVDGIIFLSAYSRDLIGSLYPESRRRDSLVTVLGHYRDVAVTPLKASPIPN